MATQAEVLSREHYAAVRIPPVDIAAGVLAAPGRRGEGFARGYYTSCILRISTRHC